MSAAAIVLSYSGLHAQTYIVGTPFNTTPLAAGGNDCASATYDPDAFMNGAGNLTVLVQANDSGSTCTNGMDSIYPAVRNGSTGAWTPSAQSACPIFMNPVKCDYANHIELVGPTASPSVTRVSRYQNLNYGRYFIAFSGGNADFERGRVYWGWSNDGGVTWDVMRNTSGPIELLGPDEPSKGPCDRHGIGQVEVQFNSVDGYFYFFALYSHFRPGYAFTNLQYRIKFNPNAPYGLSTLAADRQLYRYQDNSWVPHNGKLRFTYDGGSIEPYQWSRAFDWEGDIIFDGLRNRWVHFYTVDGRTLWNETVTSSLNSDWTEEREVNVEAIKARYGQRYTQEGSVAVWYGDLGAGPQRYIFIPVRQIPSTFDSSGKCTSCCGGLESTAIVIAPLTFG